MFEKITNKFVPEQRESSKTYRNQIGIFQGWVSTAVNSLLFIFKLFAGLITGAVSLIWAIPMVTVELNILPL